VTPRERVLLALAHRRTDRAPANYSAHQEVTDRLQARLGVRDYEGLLQALGVDLRRVRFDYYQPETGPDAAGYRRTMWGARHRQGTFSDRRPNFISPFDADTTVDQVHAHPWPDPDALDYSQVRAQCEQYGGEYATFGAPWSPFFHEVGWLIGQEEFYIWMSSKPEVVEAIVQHVVDYEVEVTRRFLAAAAGRLDIAYFGNDFGTQRGLFLSPAMWARFMEPPLRRFFALAHASGCRVMKHSCGAVRGIIPALIEAGVDILDPVQVGAAGMDLAGLVRDFGDRLCFHGGVDTQQTLPFGTPDQVRAQVRAYRDLTRAHGGYVLAGSQDFIADIPVDNILAMYDQNLRIG
jgi:uroporphyrinogen decarboxylase